MQVLHVLPTRDPAYGGPLSATTALAEACAALGVPSRVLPDPGDTFGRTLGYLPTPRGIARLVAEVRAADVVMVHGVWTLGGSAAARLAITLRRPYVVNAHGMLDRWAMSRSRWKKRVYGTLIQHEEIRRATAIRFLNDEEWQDSFPFSAAAPSLVIPNGVDAYAVGPGRSKGAYPQFERKTVVLFLGRLHPKKGLDVLVPAFARASRVCPRLHLVVAGPDEGGHERDVRRWVKEHDLEHAVTFTGLVTGAAKRELYVAADLFVLPSYQEGDSIAVKEALAAALPVIITRACRLGEIAERRAGRVIEADEAELAGALVELGGDAGLRREMGANGRGLILEKYTWDRIARRLIGVFRDILTGERRSPAWRVH